MRFMIGKSYRSDRGVRRFHSSLKLCDELNVHAFFSGILDSLFDNLTAIEVSRLSGALGWTGLQ